MNEIIIAILPEPALGKGIFSRIYTQEKSYLDTKTPTHLLKTLYDKKGKVKKKVDTITKENYQIQRNLPYIIDANQVFFPFTVRKSDYDKETRGFVNVAFVKKIQDNQIILTTGEIISTLNKQDALISNRLLAKALMYEEILKLRIDEYTTIRYLTGTIIDMD